MIKKAVKTFIISGVKLYFKVRHNYYIWYYILNRRPRKLYRQNAPNLNYIQERIVKDLNSTGISIVHLDELFKNNNILNELTSYTTELRRVAKTKTNKTFLQYLWDIIPILDFKNPFVKLTLDPKIIDIVNSYLRMYSRFYYLTLNITLPVKNGDSAFASQRWHRDPEDKKMLKIFIYLNDVDENSGPFIYIPNSKYGLKWGKVFPQRPPKGYYPPDGDVERIIPKSEIKYNVGKAGTIIFCDTTGLHKGGYAKENERVMFTAGFRSAASLWKTDFKYGMNSGLPDSTVSQVKYAAEINSTPISTRILYWLKGRIH